MKHLLKHIAHFNLPIAIVLSVGCLALWIPDFIGENIDRLPLIGCMICTILNAVTLSFIFLQRNVTRHFSGLPMFFYLLFIGLFPALHPFWIGQVAVFGIQIILLLVLQSYREQEPVRLAFSTSIFLGLVTLLMPDSIVLFPILWLMFGIHRAMSLRVFLASLIGAIVVLIYGFIGHYLAWMDFLPLSVCLARTPTTNFPISSVVLVGWGLFFVIGNLLHQNREKTAITLFVWCLILLFLVCAVMTFFPSAYFVSLLPVLLLLVAGLASYFFWVRETIASGVIFLLFITSLSLLFVYVQKMC